MYKIRKIDNVSYRMWIILSLIISSGAALVYIFIGMNARNDTWMLNNVSENSIFLGNVYTLLGTLIFVYLAIINQPFIADKTYSLEGFKKLFHRYGRVIIYIALTCLTLKILNAALFGKVDSNIFNQKPVLSLYIGYFTRLLFPAVYLYLFLNFLSGRWFDSKIILIFCLIFLWLALLGSRSSLLNTMFFVLLTLSWSGVHHKRNIFKSPVFYYVMILATLGVFAGQYGRSGQLSGIVDFQSIVTRFFINNGVLYKGMEDFESLNRVLLFNQPSGIFQNIFSFLKQRTHVSSSYRLLEVYGHNSLVSTSRGGGTHLVAYAYGWLGLTYGLSGWYGLLIIYGWIKILFLLQKNAVLRPTVWGSLVFCFTVRLMLEFFMNLGLDSYVEKIAKGFIEVLVFYLLLMSLSAFDRAVIKNSNKTPKHLFLN